MAPYPNCGLSFRAQFDTSGTIFNRVVQDTTFWQSEIIRIQAEIDLKLIEQTRLQQETADLTITLSAIDQSRPALLEQQYTDSIESQHLKAEEYFVCLAARDDQASWATTYLSEWDEFYNEMLTESRWRVPYWLDEARSEFEKERGYRNDWATAWSNIYDDNRSLFYLWDTTRSANFTYKTAVAQLKTDKVISTKERNAWTKDSKRPTKKVHESITLDRLLDIYSLLYAGYITRDEYDAAARTGVIPTNANRRVLAGTSLTRQTDMSSALCLSKGDEPVGIKVCLRNAINSSGNTITDGTSTTELTKKIQGLTMIYGYVGPRCSWTPETTENNGGFKYGQPHGVMEGECETFYFDGKEVLGMEIFRSSREGGSIEGLRLVNRVPTSVDQRRMLQEYESFTQAIEIGTIAYPDQTHQVYDFNDSNKWFGFESTIPNTSSELQGLTVVNYNQDSFWRAMEDVSVNLALADQANENARLFTNLAYEDQNWRYVEPLIESRRIELAIPLPSPLGTTVYRPADRDALQARIDTALLAASQVDDSLNTHDDDSDQDENDDLIAADIVGGIILLMLVMAHSYKYVTKKTIHEMMCMSSSGSSTPGAVKGTLRNDFVNTGSVAAAGVTGGPPQQAQQQRTLRGAVDHNQSQTQLYQHSQMSLDEQNSKANGMRALDDL